MRDLPDDLIVSFVEMASVSNDGYIQQKINRPLGELRKSSYTYFQENDIIIAKITPCMENGKCVLATELSNHIGMGSSEFHVIRSQSPTLNNAFLFHFLNRNEIRQSAEQHMTGASGHRRVPIGFYESLPVPVPSIEKQTEILAQIAQYEAQMATCEQKIQSLPAQKQAILVQYLQ